MNIVIRRSKLFKSRFNIISPLFLSKDTVDYRFLATLQLCGCTIIDYDAWLLKTIIFN